jgi:hypothetical protein
MCSTRNGATGPRGPAPSCVADTSWPRTFDAPAVELEVELERRRTRRSGDGVVVIDERVNAAQREALQALVAGEAGGPWKIISSTIAKVSGAHYMPFEMKFDGFHSSVSAGDYRTGLPSAGADPAALMRRAASEGLIDHNDYRDLSNAFRWRSAIGHGFLPRQGDQATDVVRVVRTLSRISESLLDELNNPAT